MRELPLQSPSVQGTPVNQTPSSPSPPTKRRRTSSPSVRLPSPSSPHDFRSANQHRTTYSPNLVTKWSRKPSVVWYRGNDLRVEDHPALLAAAQRGGPVVPFFVWDSSDGFGAGLGTIKQWWLRESLTHLQRDLNRLGVQLYTRTGRTTQELRSFIAETGADAVFWNRCYEPDLLKRDEELREELSIEGMTAESFKAELLVEPWELTSSKTTPRFDTFHTYMRSWMTAAPPPQPFPSPSRLLPISKDVSSTNIHSLGLQVPTDDADRLKKVWTPGSAQANIQLQRFLKDIFPAFGDRRCRRHFDGTSCLSPHIRFGELSPRRMYHAAKLRVAQWEYENLSKTGISSTANGKSSKSEYPVTSRDKTIIEENSHLGRAPRLPGSTPSSPAIPHALSMPNLKERESPAICKPVLHSAKHCEDGHILSGDTKNRENLPLISHSARAFLKNLCLRDFAYHLLYHFPDLNSQPLTSEFMNFPWAPDNGSFDSWRGGRTGYPFVDAAMRQLKQTGWIHNRMRFLLACFLTKYLLLPWSRGLKHFYVSLVDGDRSSNALGWQWTVGSNTDSFPVTCLVNPVKQAYKYDPSGDYVRRWVPELAQLPVQYIHQPWKAPDELLRKHDIRLGENYPTRIVLVSEAKASALKAMTFMKEIFSSNNTWKRLFSCNDDSLLREWPDSQLENVKGIESSSIPGKGYLLPSLWALLQCDPLPSYLSGESSGTEPLTAMETTASLVEGALAIPMDDQPESIEQALVSAHDFATMSSALSSDGFLGVGNRVVDNHHSISHALADMREEIFQSEDGKSEDLPHLHENVKFDVVQNSVKEVNRTRVSLDGQLRTPGSKQSQEVKESMDENSSTPFHRSTRACIKASSSISPPPQTSAAQILFSQLSPVTGQPQQPGQSPNRNQQFDRSPDTVGHEGRSRLMSPNTFAVHRTEQGPHHSIPIHTQFQHHVGQPESVSQQQLRLPAYYQASEQFHSQFQSSQFGDLHRSQELSRAVGQPQQPPAAAAVHCGNFEPVSHMLTQATQTSMPVAFDPMFSNRIPTSNLQGNAIMGYPNATPTHNANPTRMCGAVDPNNPSHSHALRSAPFYGFPSFVPMMNPNSMSPPEHCDKLGHLPLQSQKMAVPGMVPVAYGVYGNGVFDPRMCPTSLNLPGFGPNPYSSQPQTSVMGSQNPDLSTRPMLFQFGSHPETPHAALHHTNGQAAEKDTYVAHKIQTSTSGAMPTMAETVASNAAIQLAQVGRTAGQTSNPSSLSTEQRQAMGNSLGVGEQPSPHPPVHATGKNGFAISPAAGKHSKILKTAQQSRSLSKPKPKGKSTGKAKRARASTRSGGRRKADGRRGPRDRADSHDPKSAEDMAKEESSRAEATPKTRQKILQSVLETGDHEYRGLAAYLSETYKFTGNTDRHTSRDYVRLCNLKDDYHKKCSSEKDKLKIYRIKDFFSKVLKLEVTGEWDRHNHGGVRGPYVYGIRAKQETN